MILEYEVGLWIQIAPSSADGSIPSAPSSSTPSSSKYCDLFPLRFFPSAQERVTVVHNGSGATKDSDHYYNLSYTLNGYSRHLPNGTIETISNPPRVSNDGNDTCEGSSEWRELSQSVEHLWFYHWDDFAIPERRYDAVIDRITTRAAEYISQKKTVAISCFSGRGRSASLSASLTNLSKVRDISCNHWCQSL
jgi:hypothetical protein